MREEVLQNLHFDERQQRFVLRDLSHFTGAKATGEVSVPRDRDDGQPQIRHFLPSTTVS